MAADRPALSADNRSATIRVFVALTKKTGTTFRARADMTLAGGWTTVALPQMRVIPKLGDRDIANQ
jgi:hypothetical protein